MYDSCCLARQQAENIPGSTGLACASIHGIFENKHKNTHEYCRIHCNAQDYPELLTEDGKWYFNTLLRNRLMCGWGWYHANMPRDATCEV